jgi:hypothetical protein
LPLELTPLGWKIVRILMNKKGGLGAIAVIKRKIA